jgi:hypothetical protein
MCHQGQVLTLWHGRVLAIRWPNEFCAYVMRCRATDSHTLVRRAKSFGQDFVAGRYRPPPRRIGSDRHGRCHHQSSIRCCWSPNKNSTWMLACTVRVQGGRWQVRDHHTRHALPAPSFLQEAATRRGGRHRPPRHAGSGGGLPTPCALFDQTADIDRLCTKCLSSTATYILLWHDIYFLL